MSQNLTLALKIRALVEGMQNVEQLKKEVADLSSQAGEGVPDPTPEFRSGLEQSEAPTQSFIGGLSKMKVVALAAAAAVGAIIARAGDWVAAASKQEIAETKLETTLRNVTAASEEQIQALKDQASALQDVTTYGDEATIGAQAMLGTFGLTAEQIQQLTPNLLDMAAAMDQSGKGAGDLTSQSIALGKSLTDGISSLKRYGITISEAQEEAWKLADQSEKVAILTEILAGNFGGLAVAVGDQFAGAQTRASNAAGDTHEELGKLITQSASWRRLVDQMTGWWKEIGAGVKASAGDFEYFSNIVTRTLGGTANAIKFMWNSVQIVVKTTVMSLIEAAALAQSALAKITFGDLSRNFAQQAAELRQTAAELRDGIVLDAREAREGLIGIGEAFTDSGEQAEKGGQKIKVSLTEAEQAAQAAAEKTQALADAYDHLGIESAEATRQAGEQTVAAFRRIVESGGGAVDVLTAFDAALKQAGDPQSINALKIALYDAFNSGQISAAEYLKQIDAVDERLIAIGETVTNSADAFEHFGLTSSDALQAVADKSRQMFNVLEQSAQATTEQLEAAFLSYAEDAIRASDGIIDKQLETKAHTLGLTTEVQVLAEQYKQTGAFGREAFRIAAREARELRDAVNEINQATSRAELADMANEAARAWREGKISAGEYSGIIDEINRRRRELIQLTEEQVAAEQAATEAARKTADEVDRQASGKAKANAGASSGGSSGGGTYTLQEVAWVGGAKDLIRRDLEAAGVGSDLVRQTIAQFDKEIKDPSNLRGLTDYKDYYDFLVDRANAAVRDATAVSRRQQKEQQAEQAAEEQRRIAAAQSTSSTANKPDKTINITFQSPDGRQASGVFPAGSEQTLLDAIELSGGVAR